jgi:hypothetical protein
MAIIGESSFAMKRQNGKIGIKLPPFVQAFPDRHGRPRYYVRKRGIKRIPLPGLPWSPEFMAAHEAALGGKSLAARPVVIGESTVITGTVDAALAAYYTSGSFKDLGEETRKHRRRILENFR